MPTNKPYFSIIIPTLNEEKYLPKLLDDLNKQTYKNFEVIIVDGQSTDKTISIANKLKNKMNLQVITAKKRNVSIQRNLGAQNAIGEYLLFNDADNRLPSFFLEGLKYQTKARPTDVFTCWSSPETKNSTDKTIATACNLILEASLIAKKPSAFGAMIGCKKNVFQKTKGFNPKVGFAEDTDYVRNAHSEGFTFKVYKEPKYIYSLRRFHTHGTTKVIQQSANLLLKYYTNQHIDQKKEYPMGGDKFNEKNNTLVKKINNLLDQPIKTKKIFAKIKDFLEKDLFI